MICAPDKRFRKHYTVLRQVGAMQDIEAAGELRAL
jgi:hypothetical protein